MFDSYECRFGRYNLFLPTKVVDMVKKIFPSWIFVFYRQEDFYIVDAHNVAFTLFLLRKDLNIFREPCFAVFLFYLGNI